MNQSIFDKLLEALKQAESHNSNIMVKPEVLLWPDPERQWSPVISLLQEKLETLLIYGAYEPDKKQGPAIWIKYMVAELYSYTATAHETPIIYLPGISRQDFRNITAAGLMLQPLMEYQYTGTMWLQDNGKEWTVTAFIQNAQYGLGMKMPQDHATRQAVLMALPEIFSDSGSFYSKTFIDEEFLLSKVYPDIVPGILKWMSEGDEFLKSLTSEKQKSFTLLCKTRFGFEPNYSDIRDIALLLGSRKNAWASVWDYFANAPSKYKKIPELLRLAKPDDLGTGMFSYPEDSWPQINEEKENTLRNALLNISRVKPTDIQGLLRKLADENIARRKTVWYELGNAPLVEAVCHLNLMTESCIKPFSSTGLKELTNYYTTEGYKADQYMRAALNAVQSAKDTEAVTGIITSVYKPWLEKITLKFQDMLAGGAEYPLISNTDFEADEFVLFVDALRMELAIDFALRLHSNGYKTDLKSGWTALPTLTPTGKPFNSPLAAQVNRQSDCIEFRPQLKNGKDLQTTAFRDALKEAGFNYVSSIHDIDPTVKTWMEIGDIDTKGHSEQSLMVHRIDELYRNLAETIEAAFIKGITRIRVVTDHGWLLLPGGLPKTEISKHLTETRWGRCALIKEGVSNDFLTLPWHWNKSVFIAYAPGISFFRKNDEYAHGGISLQECLIPELVIYSGTGNEFSGKIVSVKWNNMICKVELVGTHEGFKVNMRPRSGDKNTKVIASPEHKTLVINNKCSVMVYDEFEDKEIMIELINSEGIIVDKTTAIVGQ